MKKQCEMIFLAAVLLVLYFETTYRLTPKPHDEQSDYAGSLEPGGWGVLFFDFNDHRDSWDVEWVINGITAYLMDFNQFSAYNFGGVLQYISVYNSGGALGLEFDQLPTQTTQPPENALVLLLVAGPAGGTYDVTITGTVYY